ncbi:L,D-transpeptidase family protein [Suttonella sp. R2A3]|uniref:L,D-transpeptidase family protein n=1 Tax=Suttonella sp. R2A3 TaxID=2908648 RepID=UPI001F01092D|nr:L,D-transpeptidase family protein [Suttonella sp. R2A3]UJF23862.1 L,D-transpeptidase family protein [Suttonella sp. R2A3]
MKVLRACCLLATVIYGSLLPYVYAQQTVAESVETAEVSAVENVFDEAPPNIADNLPPGVTQEALEEVGMIPLAINNDAAPAIPVSNTMQPFNSMRIKLMEVLQQPVSSVNINGQIVKLHRPQLVAEAYRSQQYPTIWTQEQQFTGLLPALQQLLPQAEQDALNPQYYHLNLIAALKPEQDYSDIIAYELLLSDAYLSLADHLANGLVDPTVTHPEWNAPKVSAQELGQLLSEAAVSGDLAAPLANLNAENARYQQMRALYNSLVNEPADASDATPPITASLKPGITHPQVPLLREKLSVIGQGNTYDSALKTAVMDFQRNNGLSADGVIGPSTRNQLNQNRASQLDKLRINLERQRWLPQSLGPVYVLVNIPSYQVQMFNNDQSMYNTRAVVGRKSRPTPAFVDRIRHVVMSPTWTVPTTIMQKDKLPQLRRNPGAFDGSYDAIAPNGKRLRPSSVNWSSGTNGYTLQQKPGPHNALGRVKFLFPNKHAIYLHDTPSKGLFNRENRAYSSGCIRIQDPLDFANILLANTEWTPDSIKSATQRSSERWVNTPQETPIYLVYWTMWSTPDGQIQSAADVYDLDSALLKQYQDALSVAF